MSGAASIEGLQEQSPISGGAAPAAMDDDVILDIVGLTKRYPGVVALDTVNLSLRNHEVLGLVGQNGSGKTTLLRTIAGLVTPDKGQVTVRGRPLAHGNPRMARAAGISMVFQEQSLLPGLTVAENILLGSERACSNHRGLYPWSAIRKTAEEQLRQLGATISVKAPVESLTHGERQTVELAKALMCGAARQDGDVILLLDEPTSTLNQWEIDRLFDVIESIKQRASVIFVSHRLEEVLRIADRAYVLRDGQCVAERTRGEWQAGEFFSLMTGREQSGDYYEIGSQVAPGPEVGLEARGLSSQDGFTDVSFQLHAGEILGICGVEGSGREKLLRALFGAEPVNNGTIRLLGKEVQISSPRVASRYGLGYVPAERTTEAALMEMDVRENMTLAHLDQVCEGPFIRRRSEVRLAGTWVRRLMIKIAALGSLMATLSGGNQQKVVFARWMLGPNLRVMLLDHPTRGLDVGAKREVYRLIRESAAAGLAILLISDSVEETVSLSHNVLVMKDGRVTGNFPASKESKPDEATIVAAMV